MLARGRVDIHIPGGDVDPGPLLDRLGSHKEPPSNRRRWSGKFAFFHDEVAQITDYWLMRLEFDTPLLRGAELVDIGDST